MTNQGTAAIETLVQARDLERLRRQPADSVDEYVVNVLNQYSTAARAMNADRLLSLGVLLAKAGHAAADRRAQGGEVSGNPELKVDVLASFLTGIWNPVFRTSPPSHATVLALVTLRGTLNLGIDAEYSYVQALCQALQRDSPSGLKSLLVPKLTEVARKPHPKPWREQITTLTAKALSRAASSGAVTT
jgi:hypothetical protein